MIQTRETISNIRAKVENLKKIYKSFSKDDMKRLRAMLREEAEAARDKK